MRAALPLGLRNALAELILDAFDAAGSRATLEALAAFCRGAALDAEATARLAGLDWFEPEGPGRLRLRGAHRAHQAALCQRASAAAGMLARGGTPDAATLAGLLARAARLGDAGLHFEVHELLEPRWMRAEGLERLALQGVIQVAVGLHHAGHGNAAGAISLLAEGLAKLEVSAAALPLETVAWRQGLAACLAAWRAGAPAPTPPRWPVPAGAAARAS